jgi:hypothetical protein
MDENDYQRAVGVKERVEDELLRRPGVHGVSVARKRVKGVEKDQAAIVVHVSRKRDDVDPAERIPPSIDGVPTDVIEEPPMAPH